MYLRLRYHSTFAFFACCSLFALPLAKAEVLRVGPGEQFTSPCQAIAASSSGDTIEIDARGNYAGDACSWSQDRLTLRGINGRAQIKAAPDQPASDALWEIQGRGTIIDNLEFSGAGAHSAQAAVLVHGGDVTVRNSAFHDNQQALVVEDGSPDAQVLIEDSEFFSNGRGDDAAAISIGDTGRLALKNSAIRDAQGGSLVRSEAAVNEIQENRFSSSGAAARQELLLSPGTKTELTGNVFEKGVDSLSPSMVQYVSSAAHADQPSALAVKENTFASAMAKGAIFLDVPDEMQATLAVQGNIFYGPGVITNRADDFTAANFTGENAGFENLAARDYRLRPEAEARGFGARPANGSAFPLKARTNVLTLQSARGSGIHMETTTPAVYSIALSPNNVSGITWTYYNNVKLTAPAPAGGLTVNLTASDPTSVSVGPRIVIPQGQSSSNFLVKVTSASRTENVGITASTPAGAKSATLAIHAAGISSVLLNPSSLGGGLRSISNQVVLSGPAPSGGLVVGLHSSNPYVASVPPSVTVPAGLSAATFAITTKPVSGATSVNVTASYAGVYRGAWLSVNPVQLASVSTMPTTVAGGVLINIMTVKLNGPAPAGGTTAHLSSSNTGVIALQSTAFLPQGSTSVNIVFATKKVTSTNVVTLSASLNGISKSANVTVTAP